MNYKIIILVISIFSIQYSKAQKSFEPGYVLLSPGDTLKGFIEYKNWTYTPKTVNFKNTLEQAAKVYGLSEISGFHVHDETYIKAEVNVDIGSTRIDKLSYSSVPELKRIVAFLMLINDGPKRLWYLKDKDKKIQLYISDKPGSYELLIDHKYLSEHNSSQVINTNQYKEQLRVFFSGCDELIDKRDVLPYSSHAIGRVFDRFYSKCSLQKEAISIKPDAISTEIGILAGISNAKLRFDPDISGYFPASNRLSGGAFINIILPRSKQRWSLYNELIFTSYQSSATTKAEFQDGSYEMVTNTMEYGYIKLSNMVRYSIPVGGIRMFAGCGISNALAITETNKSVAESGVQNTTSRFSEGYVLSETRRYEQGLMFSLGASYKRFGAELRREHSNGMSVFEGLKSGFRRNYLFLHYRLK